MIKKKFRLLKKKNFSKTTNQKLLKNYKLQYFIRKKKLTFYRKEYIYQLNIFNKKINLNYNDLIYLFKKKKILLNKKLLSQKVLINPIIFYSLVFTLLINVFLKKNNNK